MFSIFGPAHLVVIVVLVYIAYRVFRAIRKALS